MVHDRRHSRSSSASGDELEPAQQDVQPRLAADEMEVDTTLLTVGSHNHNQPAEPIVPPLLSTDDICMVATKNHAGCSGGGSSTDELAEDPEQYAVALRAEQYVSPLSATDMVALATSLLAHPHWGPSLKKERGNRGLWSEISGLRRQVLVACPHLAGACATGVALALLPLSATKHYLWVTCEDADDEAVAAFYAALEQSTCKVITKLVIEGAAFGTCAAAACLGRCLNVNSTIQKLAIDNVDGFCGQWTAFSHSLTSNATLQELLLMGKGSYVQGSSRHIAATSADWDSKLSALKSFCVQYDKNSLEDMEGWGIMLKHNSTVTMFELSCPLPHGDGLLAPIFEALLTNTTLLDLRVYDNKGRMEEVVSTDEDMDVVSLAAMLRTNRSLRRLHIRTNFLCSRYGVDEGFLRNTTLEDLWIRMDAGGAEALMTALGAISSNTSTHGPHLKSLSLYMYLKPNPGFPSALVLGNMLASNGTLTSLNIKRAPYSNEEWATIILPALAHNNSLEELDLSYCEGVDGGLVFDALLEVLESNTCIINLILDDTPLAEEGKAEVVRAEVVANKEYGAALKNVPTIAATSCRLVLCGYPFAGKSTILQTLICRHSSSAFSATLTRRTMGIDIQQLVIDDLNMWVWDFAGQREFHPLQDFIFPTGTSVHAATAFVFTFNPISSPGKASQVCLKGKRQFQQEFVYWLGFICSNSKPRPSRKYKPLVLVAITHMDQVGKSVKQTRLRTKEWVRDLATQFKDMVTLDDKRHVFFVDATNQHDLEFSKLECEVISSLRTRINNVPKVPTVCDAVAKALGRAGGGGQQLEPVISFQDFRMLCKTAAEELTSNDADQQEALASLFNTAGDKGCKAVAAYLRDAGEILYFSDLDFIVRNPRWFAHGILGHLIDIFPEESQPAQDHDEEQSQFAGEEDMFENGLVTKDFLTDVLGEAVNEVGLNPQGTDTDQLIILMEKLDLCYKAEQKYLIPALFKDEHGKAEKGERKRTWELQASSSRSLECIFVNRRLQCSDPFRTFITPGFFPRLQVVLKNEADKWGIKFGQCRCILEKGFCRLIFSDMEIMVEFSGYFDYFLDIMVKSYRSQSETIKFLEENIISKIRRLCASAQGCQGVTLVEAIIRPDCVGDDITLCRFRQALQVATLTQQASAPDLRYFWPLLKDERGNTVLQHIPYEPSKLLDSDWSGWKQVTCYPDCNVHAGRRRGVAVIVSMVKYNNCGDRSGGREDEAKLMTLIEELRFEVTLLQDFKAGELQKRLKEIAATSIRAEDESFLCFVMGHGESTLEGTHFMRDQNWDMIMLDGVVWPFRTCQHLQGKPKVFFVISCRGGYKPLVDVEPQVDVLQLSQWNLCEGAEVRYLHELKDCLMVFSTAVGAVSARYPNGAPFVEALVTNFNPDKRQTMDVLKILNDVKKEVSDEEHVLKDGTVFGQCPVVSDTLIKRLYWKSRAG